jgi:hypothetical protein
MVRIEDIDEQSIVFYDIETDSVHAPYANLKMIAYQLGIESEPQLVNLDDESSITTFKELVRREDVLKVSFNGINYDDIVLFRHGLYVEPKGRHDMYLALKTIAPWLPSYSLKYVNWHWFGDWHEPERRLNAWLTHKKLKKADMYKAPYDRLATYCKHDVAETVKIFRLIWEKVQQPQHWRVYRRMELAMANPLHEMVLLAGEWLDPDDIITRITALEKERQAVNAQVVEDSSGLIKSAGSPVQVNKYLHEIDGIELELTQKGNLTLRKSDLVDLIGDNPVAKGVYEYREISKVIEHFRSHINAAEHERRKRSDGDNIERTGSHLCAIDNQISISKSGYRFATVGAGDYYESIPKGYTISSARTRRFKSSSRYGINFQNQNKKTKIIQQVPPGWIGLWADSTQIENVVHIWKSADEVRRESYEADRRWNEYVWLTNTVLGTDLPKAELEKRKSEFNPALSVYNHYKRIRLGLSFGMGVAKFARQTKLDRKRAGDSYAQVHKACPAIHELLDIVVKETKEYGHLTDPFGHIYVGNVKEPFSIVAYFIQGCGTGSVPKAMTIANYATLHSIDSVDRLCLPCFRHPYTRLYSYGLICGTTHDECAFRISLGLSTEEIVRLIKECLYNMEERFSPLFDNIPLRAKLSVSITNAAAAVELEHKLPDGSPDPEFERRLIDEFILPGKANANIPYTSRDRPIRQQSRVGLL